MGDQKPRIARHPDRALDFLRIEADEGPAHAVTGVVDDEVGHAPFRLDRGEHRLDLRRVGGVATHRERRELLHEGSQLGRFARREGDAHSVFREQAREGGGEAGAGADDERGFGLFHRLSLCAT